MSSSSSTNVAENRNSCTEVRMERIVHNWTIKRFEFLPQDVLQAISSPWFYSQDKSEKWMLQFYPRGVDYCPSEDDCYVALFLIHISAGNSPITIYTEIKISKSDKIFNLSSSTRKSGPHSLWGCRKCLKRSELLTTNSCDDDEFTISCQIDIPVEVITSPFDAASFDSKKGQLSDDFRLLFEDPIFSDFTIIVGDEKFATHKVVLARRSPVFAAMFEHKGLEENRKQEVKIENIEPDVIRGMLEFIYTDQVTNLKELASGLLEAADKYDLDKLKAMCEKTLYEGVNKENAAEVLQLADLYRADKLKKYVIDYIVNHAPEVIKSNDWKKTGWSHELLLELVDQLACPRAVNNGESQNLKVKSKF